MKSQEQLIFDTAVASYLEGDVNAFCQLITELELILTCNCFYNEQPVEIWQTLKNKALKITDRPCNFPDNLSKGFIYLKAKDEKTSYMYLSNSIINNPSSALTYSLRARIDKEISQMIILDAYKAVELTPSARNYFLLGGIIGHEADNEINQRKSIEYYDIAISIDNNFTCAFNNKGYQHKKLKEYQIAIECYEKCIQINPNHFCYYSLWVCLDTMKEYDKALQIAFIGHEKHPTKISYHFAIGLAYMRLNNHENAICHFEKYLEGKPECTFTQKNLIACKKKFLAEKAIAEFNNQNYPVSIEYFKQYLILSTTIEDEENLRCYLIALLKLNNPTVIIGNSHVFYKLLLTKEFVKRKSFKGISCPSDYLLKYQPSITFSFGKYKRSTVIDIIDKDPQYVLWCIKNVDFFYINNNLILKEKLNIQPAYLKAIEINLIKWLYDINSFNTLKKYSNSQYHWQDDEDSYDHNEGCQSTKYYEFVDLTIFKKELEDNYNKTERIRVENNDSEDIDSDDYDSGNYEEEIEYDMIEDAFDGNSDAYWNID